LLKACIDAKQEVGVASLLCGSEATTTGKGNAIYKQYSSNTQATEIYRILLPRLATKYYVLARSSEATFMQSLIAKEQIAFKLIDYILCI
jgi:hypothetical protein